MQNYGANKRASGCFIPWYITRNGTKVFIQHQIKKSERGALTAAKRAYDNQ